MVNFVPEDIKKPCSLIIGAMKKLVEMAETNDPKMTLLLKYICQL